MEKCNKYLIKLKQLYLDFDYLKDAPFIFFSTEASELLHKIKIDVDNSYVNKPAKSFNKYSNTIKAKLNELSYDRTKGLIIEIENWFLNEDYNYSYSFKNYSIETILNLDPEEYISKDLSFPINMLQNDVCFDRIFSLQNDFLSFCKAAIVEEILKYLSSFKDLNSIDNSKNSFDISINNAEPSEIVKLTDNGKVNIEVKNFNQRIFVCANAFNLFNCFKEEIREKCLLADYSFIYRQMQEDNLIHPYVGDAEYRSFLDNELNIVIDKTKQLSGCSTSHKKSIYSTLKEQNKPY